MRTNEYKVDPCCEEILEREDDFGPDEWPDEDDDCMDINDDDDDNDYLSSAGG